MVSKASFAAVAVASLSQIVSASLGSATIKNMCPDDVYLWTVSNTPGVMQTIKSGATHDEPFQINPAGGGVSMKIATQPNLSGSITQFEYTLDDKFWYDISNINGSPFTKSGLTLTPSESSCRSIVCPAGVELCTAAYNQPDDNEATAACTLGSDATLTLCSANEDAAPSAPKVAENNVLDAVDSPAPVKAAAPVVTKAPAAPAPAANGNLHTTFVTQIVTVMEDNVAPAKRAFHRHHFHKHAAGSN